jgi:hypothetical protein
MTNTDKKRENSVRRALARQGCLLRKSRRRDPRAVDYGGYIIADMRTNCVEAGGSYFSLTLEDVEAWALDTQADPATAL